MSLFVSRPSSLRHEEFTWVVYCMVGHMPQHPKLPVAEYPTDEDISRRVYEMFLERHHADAEVDTCWCVAEEELLDREARRVLAPWKWTTRRQRKP